MSRFFSVLRPHRPVAELPQPFHSIQPRIAVRIDRRAAQLVHAPSTFDAVIDAIERGAQRVEAAPAARVQA